MTVGKPHRTSWLIAIVRPPWFDGLNRRARVGALGRYTEERVWVPPEADRCPHSIELSADFAGCRRFERVAYRPNDFGGRPLGIRVTCRHLMVGGSAEHSGPWYPRCALGGPPDFQLAPTHPEPH